MSFPVHELKKLHFISLIFFKICSYLDKWKGKKKHRKIEVKFELNIYIFLIKNQFSCNTSNEKNEKKKERKSSDA